MASLSTIKKRQKITCVNCGGEHKHTDCEFPCCNFCRNKDYRKGPHKCTKETKFFITKYWSSRGYIKHVVSLKQCHTDDDEFVELLEKERPTFEVGCKEWIDHYIATDNISESLITSFENGDALNEAVISFMEPMKIMNLDGLMDVSKENIQLADILKSVKLKPNEGIQVIGVHNQDDLQLKADEILDAIAQKKVINVLNLSLGPKNKFFKCPQFIKDVAWDIKIAQNIPFKMAQLNDLLHGLLYSSEKAFTSWHIDLSGMAAFICLSRGEKVFHILKPTPKVVAAYSDWNDDPNTCPFFNHQFRKDIIKVTLRENQLLLIPGGWPHLVYTTKKSLGMIGNFLHSQNVELQLKIHEIQSNRIDEKCILHRFVQTHLYYACSIFGNCKGPELIHLVASMPDKEKNMWKYLLPYFEKWIQDPNAKITHLSNIETVVDTIKMMVNHMS